MSLVIKICFKFPFCYCSSALHLLKQLWFWFWLCFSWTRSSMFLSYLEWTVLNPHQQWLHILTVIYYSHVYMWTVLINLHWCFCFYTVANSLVTVFYQLNICIQVDNINRQIRPLLLVLFFNSFPHFSHKSRTDGHINDKPVIVKKKMWACTPPNLWHGKDESPRCALYMHALYKNETCLAKGMFSLGHTSVLKNQLSVTMNHWTQFPRFQFKLRNCLLLHMYRF